VWDDSILREVGHGKSPVEHLAPTLTCAPFIAAHVNDASNADIEALARTRTTVAYCPRASAYFGADACFGPHRYREMLAAGINVALGTDSVINLPPWSSETAQRLSTLDEARFLYRRDHIDPSVLLRMATVNGALALGLDGERFQFSSGSSPLGITSVPAGGSPGSDVLRRVLLTSAAPELLLLAK
jgi:aminodeoxyfutalosine deaminase